MPTLFPQSGSVVKKRITHQARRLYVKRYKEKLHANKVNLSRLLDGLIILISRYHVNTLIVALWCIKCAFTIVR
nr:MAG TPA: hypothetical protein [Caudoviricetes sp.]